MRYGTKQTLKKVEELMLAGKSVEEIAQELSLSKRRIYHYLRFLRKGSATERQLRAVNFLLQGVYGDVPEFPLQSYSSKQVRMLMNYLHLRLKLERYRKKVHEVFPFLRQLERKCTNRS